MNGLFYLLFGLAGVAVVWLALRYARPILAEAGSFSSPEPMPMPGRHFRRRFKRWWRDAGLRRLLPERPGDPTRIEAVQLGCSCTLRPILDLQAGRLAGYRVHLDDDDAPTAPALSPTARDLALIARATSHGRRLGWRHSSTAVIVPIADARALLADPRGSGWLALERYSGDVVATVPPLILLIDDLAALPDEAFTRRLATARIGLALATDRPPPPTIVERVLVPATACLADTRAIRLLQPSCQVIATEVGDMATLERLARAGIRFAEGPVFGKAQPIDG